MKDIRKQVGICDESFELLTVRELIERGIIERPIDGNHGEIHPKTSDFVQEGIPFVMASDLKNGRIDYGACSRISEKQAEGLRKGFARNGDVLLTHKATIGETAIVAYHEHPYIMLTPQVTYYRIRDNDALNNRYLKYYFDSSLFQQTLQMMAGSGSTRAYLGILEQQRLPVILPSREKQKKIAAILGGLDDLIENNRRRIALLEKMAQDIYREWFVRLRFPGYDAAKFIKGMPEGWLFEEIGNVTAFVSRGIAPDYDEAASSLVINQKCVRDGRIDLEPARNLKNEIPAEKCLQVGDVLINSTGTGTLGRIAQVLEPLANTTVDTHLTIVRPSKMVTPHFFGMQLLQMEKHFTALGDGATNQTELKRELIRSSKIVLPAESVMLEFDRVCAPIRQQCCQLQSQIKCLKQTRDALLPRLISGKLSVEALNIQFPPGMLVS